MSAHRNGTRIPLDREEPLDTARHLSGHSSFLIISTETTRLPATTHAHGVPGLFPNSRSERVTVLRTRRRTTSQMLAQEAPGMVSESTWAISFPAPRTTSLI